MRRLISVGVVAILDAAWAWAAEDVAPPPPRKPAGPSPYGVVAHVTRETEHPAAQSEFALMSKAGIAWVRTDFDWDRVEKPEGVWHFEHLDETVKWADAAGIKLLVQLNYDVPWARPAHKHLDKWFTYVRKVVGRYASHVRYWEVWNEPNTPWFWGKPDAAEYTAFLKATHKAIKAIDPKLQVVFGGTYNIDLAYIKAALKAGAAPCFDVMSVHPYGTAVDSIGNGLAKLVELMERYKVAGRPIWITEWGWSAISDDPDQEREHAVNLAVGWHIALHDQLAQRIFWYEFQSEEGKPGYREHYFGLARKNLEPRPAYLAYQALTRARPAGSRPEKGEWWRQGLTYPHWVRPDGTKGWAVWLWSGEANARLRIRGRVTEAYDLLGRPLQLEAKGSPAEIRLSRSPVYLMGPEQVEVALPR